MKQEIVIVAAGRTAMGNLGGSLSKIGAPELGVAVIRGLLDKTGLSAEQIDEVILGNVLTAGLGQNPARQTLIHSGIPVQVPALTINQVCGSGLKAVHLATQSLLAGDATMVVAGGQENMSQAPHVLPGARQGYRLGNQTVLDSMLHDGLMDVYKQYHMGMTAENVAEKYGISRQEQDALAFASQQKAAQAQAAGCFKTEIIPISLVQRKGEPIVFDQDEFIRPDTTLSALAGLKPAFKKDGTVTAGNSSGINDGAAVVFITTAARAKELGLTPLVRIAGYASTGVDPALMGIGPVTATQRALSKAGWTLDDLDLIEANEAFAAQALAVAHELQWDMNKVNVNGGAIALGHPIGASGCRILVTLIHEMLRRKSNKGLATLCIGGGMGVALAVERVGG